MSLLDKFSNTAFGKSLIGTVSSYDALPKDGIVDINKAYIMQIIIQSENDLGGGTKNESLNNRPFQGITIIKAFCPETLSLNFQNEFQSIDPMSLKTGALVNGAVQLLTGRTTRHRVNNIRVWTSAQPLSFQVKFELYATKNVTSNKINTGNSTITSGGMSSNDLIYLLRQLTALAQPRIDEKSGWLIPPGPSPLIAKYDGDMFTVKKSKDKNGKEVSEMIHVTNKNNEAIKAAQYTKTGTRVDIKFGDFMWLSHVLVKGVNVEIPYVMANNSKPSSTQTVGNADRSKPVMATVTMNFETKTMVDQETFAKMLNFQEQSNPAEIDITALEDGLLKSAYTTILNTASNYTDQSKVISNAEADVLSNTTLKSVGL